MTVVALSLFKGPKLGVNGCFLMLKSGVLTCEDENSNLSHDCLTSLEKGVPCALDVPELVVNGSQWPHATAIADAAFANFEGLLTVVGTFAELKTIGKYAFVYTGSAEGNARSKIIFKR